MCRWERYDLTVAGGAPGSARLELNRALRLAMVTIAMGEFRIATATGRCTIATGTVADCPLTSTKLSEALVFEDNTSSPVMRTSGILRIDVSGDSLTLWCSPNLWSSIADGTRVSVHSQGRLWAY